MKVKGELRGAYCRRRGHHFVRSFPGFARSSFSQGKCESEHSRVVINSPKEFLKLRFLSQQKTKCTSITETDRLILFREKVAAYLEILTNRTNTRCD